LNELCPAIKISSGDNTFFPLIERIAGFRKPILLSSGLAEISDVDRALSRTAAVWRDAEYAGDVVLLHCVSSYPTPINEANLGAIRTLAARFGKIVGYSDHTLGIEAAILSTALGARVIEKHFTLDKNYSDFRDHQLSADPAELAELVRRVKLVVELLGDGRKTAQPSEDGNRMAFRRSIAAGRDLAAGTVLQWDDLTWVRPGSGIAPGDESAVLGRALKRSVMQGELLQSDNLV
jgi:N-acetylneuraminate synthase/N,N'-diacetyllegionaminate synthase